MIDSANVAAGLDDPSNLSNEEYDGVWVTGNVVASGQSINYLIELADIKRAINQTENCFDLLPTTQMGARPGRSTGSVTALENTDAHGADPDGPGERCFLGGEHAQPRYLWSFRQSHS
jgi:hypothetical protein